VGRDHVLPSVGEWSTNTRTEEVQYLFFHVGTLRVPLERRGKKKGEKKKKKLVLRRRQKKKIKMFTSPLLLNLCLPKYSDVNGSSKCRLECTTTMVQVEVEVEKQHQSKENMNICKWQLMAVAGKKNFGRISKKKRTKEEQSQ
jgi:hypothetical protein